MTLVFDVDYLAFDLCWLSCDDGAYASSEQRLTQSTQRRIIAKSPEILPFVVSYNYDRLDKKVAAYVRSVAARFPPSKRRRLDEVIADGSELWAVKKLLLRGEFDGWRRAVFGPRERTAENCMAVAKWLESKSEILRICHRSDRVLFVGAPFGH